MKQLSLNLDAPPRPVGPRDPKVTKTEARRLSAHSRSILERLRAGACTNREFVGEPERYGMNLTGRISDLRGAGFEVACDQDRRSGLATYSLTFDPESRS